MREGLVADALGSVGRAMDWIERGFARPAFPAVFVRRERLVRLRHPRMIAGVCSGVARHFGWNLTVLRLLVAVAALGSFGAVAAGYFLAWVLLPEGLYGLGDGRAGNAGVFRS